MSPRGDRGLTRRQAEVLRAVLEGLSDKEIAGRLNVSLSCAKFHVQRLFRKFRVHDRHGLADKFGRFEVVVRWVPTKRWKRAAREQTDDELRPCPHRVRIND